MIIIEAVLRLPASTRQWSLTTFGVIECGLAPTLSLASLGSVVDGCGGTEGKYFEACMASSTNPSLPPCLIRCLRDRGFLFLPFIIPTRTIPGLEWRKGTSVSFHYLITIPRTVSAVQTVCLELSSFQHFGSLFQFFFPVLFVSKSNE